MKCKINKKYFPSSKAYKVNKFNDLFKNSTNILLQKVKAMD